MLLGEFQHSVDEKGRLAVPAKFRKSLSGGVVIAQGIEQCLYLYSVSEWEKFAEKLSQQSISRSDSRAFARVMLARASHSEIDGQGRILIPDHLRQYAGLKNDAIVIGLYNRAEIWDRDRWAEYRSGVESKTEEIAERLGQLGF